MTRNRILFALVLIVVVIAPRLTMAQNLAGGATHETIL
jgi:hypothetical protein